MTNSLRDRWLIALFLLLTLANRGVCHAQWVQNNPFPGGSRLASVCFMLNEEAYLVGGLVLQSGVYSGFNDLWRYNEVDDTWTELDPYPPSNIYGGVSFVLDGFAYVGLGGNQNGTLSAELRAYDPIMAQWSTKADFPGDRRVYAFSFSADGKGYVGGGVRFVGGSPVYLNDVWCYDPIGNAWSAVAPYPGGGRVGCASFSIANKGYVGLGDDGGSFHSDMHMYNPVLDAWSALNDFTGGSTKSFPSCVSMNDDGFMLGGESGNLTFTNQMHRYHQPTDTWSTAYDFTGTARRYGLFYLMGSTFYYGLGQIGPTDANVASDFWELTSDVGVMGAADEDNTAVTFYPNPVPVGGNVSLTSDKSGTLTLWNLLGETLLALPVDGSGTPVQLPQGTRGALLVEFIASASGRASHGLLIVE